MIEELKQALEALKDFGNHRHDCPQWPTYTEPEKYPACDCGYDKALKSIDQAIAVAEQHTEAEKQEPVAVVDANDDGYWADILPDRSVKVGQLLYTHPYVPTERQPKRAVSETHKWVGLTVMEAVELELATNHPREFAAAIEAKLKEKNSG